MEQYELSIDISNHEDMNHTFINIYIQYIGMRHLISHQKIIDNDQNVFVLLKGKEMSFWYEVDFEK